MNSQAEAYLNASEAAETSQDTTLSENSQDQNIEEQSSSSNGGAMMSQEPSNTTNTNSHLSDSRPAAEASSSSSPSKSGGKELIEQFEPGVYVTYVLHKNGGKIFRRVRFRYLTGSKFSLFFVLDFVNHFEFFAVNGDLMSIKQKNGGIAKKIGCLRVIVIRFHHQVLWLVNQFLHKLQLNHQLRRHSQILMIKKRVQNKFLTASYVYTSN